MTTDAIPGSGAMFDRIAARYDGLNRVLSLGLDQRWRTRLVDALPRLSETDEVLDLATGTADVALAIAGASPCRVVGLDPSPEMLAVGQRKCAESSAITLVEGDAQALEFDDDRFAAVTMAFGIRNVPDRLRALREMCRVTRPGGHVLILELGQPGGRLGRLGRRYIRRAVPLLGRVLSSGAEYRYLAESIANFPSAAQFMTLMTDAGLRNVQSTPLTFGAVNLFEGRVP